MNADEMKSRTKAYALRVLKLAASLPKGRIGDVIGYQMAKAGTSVAANYRAACRGRSKAEFLAKRGIVEEECDESLYWIETSADADLVPKRRVVDLLKEGEEILAMIVSSIRTARAKASPKSAIRNPRSAI